MNSAILGFGKQILNIVEPAKQTYLLKNIKPGILRFINLLNFC